MFALTLFIGFTLVGWLIGHWFKPVPFHKLPGDVIEVLLMQPANVADYWLGRKSMSLARWKRMEYNYLREAKEFHLPTGDSRHSF